MRYNTNLKKEEIEELEKNRSIVFEKIGKYEIQRNYYEEKIKEQIEIIDFLNKKLWEEMHE